jgi:DNA-binding NtrC family response regulator
MSVVHALPTPRVMPTLQFEIHGLPHFGYPLRGGRCVLGRADSCDVALPFERISRIHCVVEHRGDRWQVVDRSRNGTFLNGKAVERRQELRDGDVIQVGEATVRFIEAERDIRPTDVRRVQAAIHEEPVGMEPDGLLAQRVGLRSGDTVHVLRSQRTWLGGPGADLVIDPHLPARACRVLVVRGRPMVQAGEAAAFVAGQRVRETLPIYVGEVLRLGDHELAVEHVVKRRGREIERLGEMVGSHPAMQRLFGALEKAAAHDHAVLLVGESGTGKELAARALHDTGPRAEGPYVAVNVAALTENLFESELFGHEKGAFTGAVRRQDGAFHRADSGTLFLDEIGELALPLQAKLLRTLESGEVRRVGGSEVAYPDVRIVCATNRDLPQMVRDGTFRQDLYFRLCQLPVRLPPLRARRSDIEAIAWALLRREHPEARLTAAAIAHLESHDWPGNIRELRNVLRRAVVMGGPTIDREDLEFSTDGLGMPSRDAGLDFQHAERKRVRSAMEQASGNKAKAARILGIPRTTLGYKLKKLGLT